MRLPAFVLMGLLSLAAVLSACGPAPGSQQVSSDSLRAAAPPAGAPNAAGGIGAGALTQRSAANTSATSGQPVSAQTQPDVALPPLDRMIVATVNLSINAQNAVEAERQAESVAARYGGFVGSSNVRDVDGVRQATVTIRIPTARFTDALAELRGIGERVTDETRSTQDVTEEYTDVQSNVRNLQSTEARILSLMEKTTTLEQTLQLQRELTNVRGQIERLQGRQRVLESQSDLATIALRITEPVVPAPPRNERTLSETLALTLAQSVAALEHSVQGLLVVGIWVAVFSPLYGIPALAIAWWLRRPRPAASASPAAA
ncbi:MAG: hypothetical protein QOF51_3734 [Chloroflexota bacterium]|nr:hypothetical protein [Chloroflexota bacterium]